MGYEAYVLTPASREELLRRFPAKFPDVICHHITHVHGVQKGDPSTYGSPLQFEVYGYLCDESLEAVLVKPVNGSPIRANGQRYHVTMSLDRSKGRKPVHSNDLISRGNWMATPPIIVEGIFQYLT